MRRRSFYQRDGKIKHAILRKTEERESKKEQTEAYGRFECKKCRKIFPRGLYLHEKHCKS